ncbi:TPA: hypothetical protein UMU63_002704 [Stenotrophomonas maltophilia]|uniref:hypothetical protein n=1 Tax=Stenotrophomonas maltophilia TaxID=40324 RepID=UPI001110CA68|nr:hypothetical protein [Stenotrophomonas maltophilia]TIL17754.1 hypothetical protein E4419_00795 [Stenotrophomonas maltophilia]HEL3737757.1 hypothetical protein [Stenotrophomonas maltophilia]
MPYSFTAEDYRSAVEELLSSLPSVTDIVVDVGGLARSPLVTEEPVNMREGEGLPYYGDARILFSVYIPRRVQEELANRVGIQRRVAAENFRVDIRTEYHGPVAFVECVGGGHEEDPSMSVFLVREYLKKHLEGKDGVARFDYMGPSPFHAEFYLNHGAPTADSSFKLTYTPLKGYDNYLFEVDRQTIDDSDLFNLYDEMAGELSLYYFLVRRRRDLLRSATKYEHRWAEVRKSVDSARFSNVLGAAARHRDVRSLISDGYALQAEIAVVISEMKLMVAREYENGTPSYFERSVRKVVEQFPEFSVDPILRWAEHVDGASYKKLEIMAVIAASVIGGLIGALITSAIK